MRGVIRDTQGQGLMEYALLLTLVAGACVVAVARFGDFISPVLMKAAALL